MAVVLPFHPQGDPIANRGIGICSSAAGSLPNALWSLFRLAIGIAETQTDHDGTYDLAFAHASAVRVAAMSAREVMPPLGFALAVPVASPQELADVLRMDRFESHVRESLDRKRSWALLVAVDPTVRRTGIGRTLANAALNGIRGAQGERVYVAARARDSWIAHRLLGMRFSRDGVSSEVVPRVLFSSRSLSFD